MAETNNNVDPSRSASPKLNERSVDWCEQQAMSRLCNDLMGGTKAMRLAGEDYLPKKPSETEKDYRARLNGAYLDNFFQKTVIFYLGQVFKKELDYQNAQDKDADLPYDIDWFDGFQENVDLAGNNLTVFGKQVFQAGMVDGVTFVLTDYVNTELDKDPENGQLMFKDTDGEWKVKNATVDERLNLRPYFIHVMAKQVLDVWVDVDGGAITVKHFRYKETVEIPKKGDVDGLDREKVEQIIAWWPHKWEKWQVRGAQLTWVAAGDNTLGKIPLAWFRPGEPSAAMTARPPLDDLAELNRVYWAAAADHDGRLMPYVRSPAAFGVSLGLPEDKKIEFGPARMIQVDNPNARLESVGIDSASAVNSQTDLREKREAMRGYGYQEVEAGVTATMSQNAATNAASSLKGWCAVFKDCLENAHRYVSMYQGWEDGPAILVNTEFKNSLDLNLLSHLQQSVNSKIIDPKYYVQQLLSMMPYSDEWTVENVINPDFGKDREYELPEFGGLFSKPSVEGQSKTPAGER
jgi:hypothetical protein